MNPIKAKSFSPYSIQAGTQRDLTSFSFKMLLDQVTQHKIVLLRGFNPLERDELLNYCQSQAQLLSWDFGSVMEMKVNTTPRNYLFTESDVPLHWDGAFHQEPRFLLFHCLQAPTAGSGGETLFVNTESVWQAASDEQKKEWRHYSFALYTEKMAHYGGSITCNLVNIHPDTHQIILRFAEPVGEDYLNPVQITVIGKSKKASQAILSTLSQSMRMPQHIYQHQWQEGDFLLADNFALLHGRNAFHRHTPRHLRRIQIL